MCKGGTAFYYTLTQYPTTMRFNKEMLLIIKANALDAVTATIRDNGKLDDTNLEHAMRQSLIVDIANHQIRELER